MLRKLLHTVLLLLIIFSAFADENSLDKMAFMPSGLPAAEDTVFNFTADGSPYEYTCIVRLVEAGKTNTAPTLECATAASLSARVPEGGICGGTLAASDPEGDSLVFEITSYPRHGSVILSDRESGRYLYRPSAGYTGRDSFSYTVRDEWGNYAGEAEVFTLGVEILGKQKILLLCSCNSVGMPIFWAALSIGPLA